MLPVIEPYRAPPVPSQNPRRSLDRSQSSSYSTGQQSAYPANMTPPTGPQYAGTRGDEYPARRPNPDASPSRQLSQSQNAAYSSPQSQRGDPASPQRGAFAGRPPPTSSSPVSMTARGRDSSGNGPTEGSRQGSPYRAGPGQDGPPYAGSQSAHGNTLQHSTSSSAPPSRSGHSPAPAAHALAHSQSRSAHPQPAQGRTIAGEPLHDMQRAIALLKSSKFYAEGFLMKRVEAGPDGKPVRPRVSLLAAARSS